MTRRKFCVVLVLLLVVLLVLLVVKKGVKLPGTQEVFSEIPENVAKEVEQLFWVELPEYGNVIYYDALLEKDALGHFYAEIELPEECYEEIIAQIEKSYVEPTLEYPRAIFENTFGIDDEELDKIYHSVGAYRRELHLDKVYFSFSYYVYTMEVEDGTFRIFFVSCYC